MTTFSIALDMHVRLMMQPPHVRRQQRGRSSLHHRGLTRLEASRKKKITYPCQITPAFPPPVITEPCQITRQASTPPVITGPCQITRLAQARWKITATQRWAVRSAVITKKNLGLDCRKLLCAFSCSTWHLVCVQHCFGSHVGSMHWLCRSVRIKSIRI